jgi:hypothetical protein
MSYEYVNKLGSPWRYIAPGAIMGGAFVALFVRIPHWAGTGPLVQLAYGTIFFLFAYGGAYAGARYYDRLDRQARQATFPPQTPPTSSGLQPSPRSHA